MNASEMLIEYFMGQFRSILGFLNEGDYSIIKIILETHIEAYEEIKNE